MAVKDPELTQLLRKFKNSDFEFFINKWGVLKITDFSETADELAKLNKYEFIQKAVKLFKKKKLGVKDYLNLNLIYMQKYPKTKLWTVFKISNAPGTTSTHDTLDPVRLSDHLQEELSLFYKANVAVKVHNQAYWMTVLIEENKQISRRSLAYVVHQPKTEYLMVANLKAGHIESAMQCLMTVLNCEDYEQLKLQGHHLDSLVQLAVNKYSQGSFSEYRLCNVDENPLLRKTRKRELRDVLSDDEDLEPQIILENQQEKRKRLELVSGTFGPNVQPTLEKVEYKLETKFRGTEYAKSMNADKIFNVKVKFEGPNVLEGIKNLGKSGVAAMPMKDHMRNLPHMAVNHISLRAKKKAGQPT